MARAKSDAQFRTVEGIQKHPLWLQLTGKQQTFLRAFLGTNDRIAAIQSAYSCANENACAVLASNMLKRAPIRALLAIFHGYEDFGGMLNRKEFLELVSSRLRSRDLPPGSFKWLAQLYAELQGWTVNKPRKEDEEELINAAVRRVEQSK